MDKIVTTANRKAIVNRYKHHKSYVKDVLYMELYVSQMYYYEKTAEDVNLSWETVRKVIAQSLRGWKRRKPKKRSKK
jgi:hypothetical protein